VAEQLLELAGKMSGQFTDPLLLLFVDMLMERSKVWLNIVDDRCDLLLE
jgi:hypothetical protein